MNIAELLKKNFVLVPIIASVVVGGFTSVKYIVSLTSTINDNKQEIVLLHKQLNETNENLKKSNQDVSNIYGIIETSKSIMEIMGGQLSDLQWEVRDLSR